MPSAIGRRRLITFEPVRLPAGDSTEPRGGKRAKEMGAAVFPRASAEVDRRRRGINGGAAYGGGSWPLGGGAWPLGTRRTVALGYHPDLPDSRDHVIGTPSFAQTESSVALKAMAAGATVRAAKGDTLRLLGGKSALPKRVHLGDTGFMPVIEDQGEIGSCTANAVIGIAEYLIRAAGGRSLDLSRMFLYKVTRRLLGWTGDTGAYVRTTIQALRLFGVPPEADWPYDGELLDAEPDAYHYSYAQNFRGLCFARLDGYGDSPNGTSRGAATLTALKRTLADGFPVAFGFPVYESIQNMGSDFVIPLPQGDDDRIVGGHAVVAVGYDDSVKVPGQSGAGAVIVRNSWGVEWGDLGYGFLPFDYVRRELAVDWWTLFHTDFVELSHFY